jgi:hypothetical protein
MKAVQQIRRENQKIRLLEIPLSNAATADEAAAAPHRIFPQEFGDNKKGANVPAKTRGGRCRDVLADGLRDGTVVLSSDKELDRPKPEVGKVRRHRSAWLSAVVTFVDLIRRRVKIDRN